MRTSHYLGGHKALITTTDNLKLYVDTRDLSLTPHLLVDGYWEKWVAEHVRRTWVTPGMTVIEVGSNIGYYTTLMSYLVGISGRVIGFEPVADFASLASASLDINGCTNASIEVLAVGDRIDDVEFTICELHQGSSSIHRIDKIAPDEPVTRVTVPMTTLDEYCFHNDVFPDLLKIDAEGAEPAVLRGATRLLGTYRLNKILLEVNYPVLTSVVESLEEMLDGLRAQHFSLTEVHPEGLRPVTYSALKKARVCEVYAERKG